MRGGVVLWWLWLGCCAQALDLLDVFKLTKMLSGEASDVWRKLASPGSPTPPFIEKDHSQKLLDAFHQLRDRLDKVEEEARNESGRLVGTLSAHLPLVLSRQLRMHELTQIVAEIDRKNKLLEVYRSADATHGLMDLSTAVLGHQYDSVFSMWDRLHTSFLVPDADYGGTGPSPLSRRPILNLVASALQEYEENLCDIQQSPMQILYNLYNHLQLTQLKAYTIMQFAWLYQKTNNNSLNYDRESQAMKQLYQSRLSEQAETAKDAMKEVSQALYRCDPREHVEDETYTTLTYFLQGFLLNEVDMNTDSTCREDCGYYKFAKQHGCYQGNYCSKQPLCRGDIVNCRFVDSDMWVCPSDYAKTKRRYDWIKYENGRNLGQTSKTCKNPVDKVDSWWRWLFWHCSFCFCVCDESNNKKSDRYFSLTSSLSDVKNNRVLTGLKMVKHNQVIYLQGQEGKLKQDGGIDADSLRWVQLDEVNPHSNDFKEGQHYYKMSFNQRSVDLDDLIAPNDHLLTGVRWRKVGQHLNLEIHVCKWNFTSGQLLHNGLECHWIANDNTDASPDNPRKKIYLNSPDNPTTIRVPSRIDSKSDEFVEFTHTTLEEDVAQTAVPFMDTQEVVPRPAVPLVGAGIYHKGMYKSGGYIAPKVFTIDYSKYIQTDFNSV